ncbi:helix-turn-helix transcriptional regulator [Streptomyces cacaoi]|uniref:Transcriptional regulator n=1 Tax=Streptomyces cacaoi TaxID=1898 RepID=A0A4Y3QYQ7_STRCI|nr:helix-turn-helix transcriptional regulator [Streptomyces cacaoi]NNG87720.1 helix-turn-helix domain-containing protein [Streptomyces cacaoi]GEB50099.1 transcriptional regulator [Streptomyces cacaoi]
MDRRELAGFLRGRRERITPAAVGLPAGPRRRTPGLRREEVAHLAFISTEYYTRLEQARGPRPSREVLAGLTRALRLSDAERDHLHHLAGAPPGPPAGPSRDVPQSILDLLRRLPHTAAVVLSATYEVLAWNDLAAALLEDFSAVPRRERNLVRRAYLAPRPRERLLYDPFDAEAFARAAARRLRATAARYPEDPEVARLVGELLSGSAEFSRLWDAHDVRPESSLRKTVNHPLIGPIALNCDLLDISDQDQQLVLYTVEPGSPAEEALRLLSVIGTQRMDVPG